MPNISFYMDEDLYVPLKREAERNGKELYGFVRDVLRKACENSSVSPRPRPTWPTTWFILADYPARKSSGK